MIKVAFVILNYKTFNDTVLSCNEILSEINDEYKIVVVDNASPNESFETLCDMFKNNKFVDIIQCPTNGGFAKGNNYGLRFVSRYNPEYVCVINNDVHFTRKTIDYLAEIYRSLDAPAVISPIQLLPNQKQAKIIELSCPSFWTIVRDYSIIFARPLHKYFSNTKFDNVQQVEWIQGAFSFIKYETFKKIGFFDESTFLYGEEDLLARKVKDEGLKNYIILNHKYIHSHSKTISSVFSVKRQLKMKYDGKIIFLAKYSRKYLWLKKLVVTLMYYHYSFCIYIWIIIKRMKNVGHI